MIPSPANIVRGFPTLHELPDTVAETVNAMPYHEALQSAPSSMNTLMMAVNAVEKVDAPQPQGRNDSVVSHLDAQAKAAEHMARSMLFLGPGDQIGTNSSNSKGRHVAVGLGITDAIVHLDAKGPASKGMPVVSSNRAEPANVSLGEEYQKDERKRGRPNSSRKHGKGELRTGSPGYSVSPGPDRKKQRV
jgi:hypothetical protein